MCGEPMKKIWLAFLVCFLGARVSAVEIIHPSELKPGMKGYGLTVLSGYRVERFEVEVIDVMPKALPAADMILVRCSGAGLEKSKLIAGMSGSPVYFDGRLAGAIAYTWGFQQEPIGGITPIQAMLDASELNRPALKAEAGPDRESALSPSLKPIGLPVMISGLDPALFPEAEKLLGALSLGPLTSGGGQVEDREAPLKVEPGAALGVQLISGDLNAAAVGTATLVEGNTVVAFGHGLFNGGALALPLVLAKVNTVIGSNALSFKMASPARELGTLKGDFSLAVSGKLDEKPRMIPVAVEVKNQAIGQSRTFHYNVGDHPLLSLKLVQLCLLQSLSLTGAVSDYSTVSLEMELLLEGRPQAIHYHDLFTLNKGSFTGEYILPAMIFSANPYQKVKLSGLNFKLEVRPGWELAEIKSVWASKMEVAPGETITIGVRLKRFRGEEFEKRFLFEVPRQARGMLNLNFMGAEQMQLDIAQPESIEDLVAAFKKFPEPTWLVVQYPKPGLILDYGGERLRSLPPSVRSVLSGWANTGAKLSPDFEYLTLDASCLVRGNGALQLKVKPESGRTKK
jgi:hypothetical protein